MDTITSYIKPELLVLVPALYFIGTMLKSAQDVKDKYIPLILGACGIVLATAYVMASALPQAAASVIRRCLRALRRASSAPAAAST